MQLFGRMVPDKKKTGLLGRLQSNQPSTNVLLHIKPVRAGIDAQGHIYLVGSGFKPPADA